MSTTGKGVASVASRTETRLNPPATGERRCVHPRKNRCMNITIEGANDAAALRDVRHVREEVFGRQCYRRLPRLEDYDPKQILTLVARLGHTNEPIAALTVVETTGDAAQHSAFGLSFPFGSRVARYTQLAVYLAYRGLQIPARMVEEARRRFVLPNQILYTWLLFNAEHAKKSSFCKELGFKYSEKEYSTEYGRSRVLVRKERNGAAELSEPLPVDFNSSRHNGARNGNHQEQVYAFPRTIVENEWLAH